jgi:hypothetical protein
MNPQYRRLPETLETYQVNLQDRSYLLAIAVARHIAYSLPIPTSPAIIPLALYAQNCSGSVNDELSAINEVVVINFDLAVSLVKKLWLLRYNTVHDMTNPQARQVIDSAIAIGTTEVPPHVSEIYRKYESKGLFSSISELLKVGREQQSAMRADNAVVDAPVATGAVA